MPPAPTAGGPACPGADAEARDDALDLALAVLLVVGTVGWGGLGLGLAGWFGGAGIAGLAGAGALAAWVGRWRGRGTGASRRGVLEAIAVFLVAATVLLPGWDVAIYGSDATVYRSVGVHLARTGSLAVDDPLLADIWLGVPHLFPETDVEGGATRLRSPAGLAFVEGTTRVWSAFSQLPSVWLAVGWMLGGARGAAAVTPLLAAGALTFFWLLLRRHAGLAVAAVATGLEAVLMVQVMIARLGLAEVAGEFLLWGGCLALLRWEATRALAPALAAGVAFGLAPVARLEYLAFVPLALGIAWLLPGGRSLALPRSAVVVAVAGWLTAAVLLFVVPSHYRFAFWLFVGPVWRIRFASSPWTIAAIGLGLAALAGGAVVAVRRALSGRPTFLRAAVGAGLAAWAVLFVMQRRSVSAGQMLAVLRAFTAWPVLLLALGGLVPLGRACWRSSGGRLAFLLAMVAGVHFAVDLHASAGAVWAGRRLLPVVLPVLCAAVGAMVAVVGRRVPTAGLALAAFALLATAEPTLRWVQQPWYVGASEQVGAVARLLPPDAVVIVDPGLTDTLIDVPLWLEHGHPSILLAGAAGAIYPVIWLALTLPGRQLVLIRHAFLGTPVAPVVQFTPVGSAALRILAPTVGSNGTRATLLPLAAWAVRPEQPSGKSAP